MAKEKKILTYDADATTKLRSGINKLTTAVVSTLGPGGQNVLIETIDGKSKITKDGVTVAKSIELKDPLENIGAQLVKQVSLNTNLSAGDGTTTATLLAAEIIDKGIKAIAAGINPIEMKRGIEKGVQQVVSALTALSRPVTGIDEIRQIATISANNDPMIGELIATAMDKVGRDGVILAEEGKSAETRLDFVEGMQFKRGYISPYFINNTQNMSVVLDNPYILLYDKKISDMDDITPILEQVSAAGRSVLVICDDMDGAALALSVVNSSRGVLRICAIKSPDFGERKTLILSDIAVLTGATVLSEAAGRSLRKATIADLGEANKVTVTKSETTIIGGKGDEAALTEHAEKLKQSIDESESLNEKESIQKRLASLIGGVAIIYIGANSELELKEKRDRVDDALQATRAAVEEGIIPGGGMALIRAEQYMDPADSTFDHPDQILGFKIIRDICSSPFKQIVRNVGQNPDALLAKVQYEKGINLPMGYDARKNEIVNLIAAGIIDPTKVTRTAIQNAASVAGTVLTTKCIVSIDPESIEKNTPEYNPYNFEQ